LFHIPGASESFQWIEKSKSASVEAKKTLENTKKTVKDSATDIEEQASRLKKEATNKIDGISSEISKATSSTKESVNQIRDTIRNNVNSITSSAKSLANDAHTAFDSIKNSVSKSLGGKDHEKSKEEPAYMRKVKSSVPVVDKSASVESPAISVKDTKPSTIMNPSSSIEEVESIPNSKVLSSNNVKKPTHAARNDNVKENSTRPAIVSQPKESNNENSEKTEAVPSSDLTAAGELEVATKIIEATSNIQPIIEIFDEIKSDEKNLTEKVKQAIKGTVKKPLDKNSSTTDGPMTEFGQTIPSKGKSDKGSTDNSKISSIAEKITPSVDKLKTGIQKVEGALKNHYVIDKEEGAKLLNHEVEKDSLSTVTPVTMSVLVDDQSILKIDAKSEKDKSPIIVESDKAINVSNEQLGNLPVKDILERLRSSISLLKERPLNDEEMMSMKSELNQIQNIFEHQEEEEYALLEAIVDAENYRFAELMKKKQEETIKALSQQEENLRSELTRQFEEEIRRLNEESKKQMEDIMKARELEHEHAVKEGLSLQKKEIDKKWTHEIKKRVDDERAGRLARLDHLALKLKYLERIAIENGEQLIESARTHQLWSAFMSWIHAVNYPIRAPFQREIHLLQHLGGHYPVLDAAISSIPSHLAERGVATTQDLKIHFIKTSKAIRKASLMPPEGGIISYGVSALLSKLMFKKHGLIPGNSVDDILSRAEYYLEDGDVDRAAREINQLKGWPKRLAKDWLDEARDHLTVRQAVDVSFNSFFPYFFFFLFVLVFQSNSFFTFFFPFTIFLLFSGGSS